MEKHSDKNDLFEVVKTITGAYDEGLRQGALLNRNYTELLRELRKIIADDEGETMVKLFLLVNKTENS